MCVEFRLPQVKFRAVVRRASAGRRAAGFRTRPGVPPRDRRRASISACSAFRRRSASVWPRQYRCRGLHTGATVSPTGALRFQIDPQGVEPSRPLFEPELCGGLPRLPSGSSVRRTLAVQRQTPPAAQQDRRRLPSARRRLPIAAIPVHGGLRLEAIARRQSPLSVAVFQRFLPRAAVRARRDRRPKRPFAHRELCGRLPVPTVSEQVPPPQPSARCLPLLGAIPIVPLFGQSRLL